MSTFLIISENLTYREFLGDMLKQELQVSNVHVCQSNVVKDILDTVKGLAVDLCIIDWESLDDKALQILLTLHSISPDTSVCLLTLSKDIGFITELHKHGVNGVIDKRSEKFEIIEGIKRILQKGWFMSKNYTEIIAYQGIHGLRNDPFQNLSARESKVMLLLASGLTVKEIGEQMFLSPRTVSTYKYRVFQKLGFKNMSHLITFVMQNK